MRLPARERAPRHRTDSKGSARARFDQSSIRTPDDETPTNSIAHERKARPSRRRCGHQDRGAQELGRRRGRGGDRASALRPGAEQIPRRDRATITGGTARRRHVQTPASDGKSDRPKWPRAKIAGTESRSRQRDCVAGYPGSREETGAQRRHARRRQSSQPKIADDSGWNAGPSVMAAARP